MATRPVPLSSGKIVRYPEIYSRILLSIPDNGEPLDIPLANDEAAKKERLQFYNFLKFLRRNPKDAVHFGHRHNLVIMKVTGNILSFALRRASTTQNLEESFRAVSKELSRPVAGAPVLSVAPDVSDSIQFSEPLEVAHQSQIDPMALLNAALDNEGKIK